MQPADGRRWARKTLVSSPVEAGHVLGPLLIRVPCAGRAARLWAGVRGLAGFGLLALAACLSPDPRGVGTHTHLGLPPCGLMLLWGVPCPTCGMTTAFAHTVRGHWLAACRTQPAGFLAAVATAVYAAVSAATVASGRQWRVNWYRVRPARVVTIIVAIVLLAWAYRIAVALTWGPLL
jgi:hypothetical protein